MLRRLSFVIILTAALAAPLLLNAASVTIYPSEDTYSDSNSPAVNNGTTTVLSVVNFSPMFQYSYIKFNSGDIPMGTITGATLYLYSGYSMGNPSLQFQACAAPWSETVLNYSNAPGVMGAAYGMSVSDTIIGYNSVAITNMVTAWKTGPNNGLRINMTAGMQAVFYSRESGALQTPYLVINYTPPPGTPTVSPTITTTWTNSPVYSPTETPTITLTHTITPTHTVSPTSSILTIPEAVDNPGLVFTNGGNANWFGQTLNAYSGGDAARSGAIGHNQSSYMETTVTGPGTLSFYWSVSSESCCDYLRLSVDGMQVNSIAGNINWTLYTYNITAGTHVIRWTYSKDGSVVTGSDCGWVDQIQFGYMSPTVTRTATSTRTISPTWSISRTHTISPTFTATRTITQTRTISPTFTNSPTLAPTLGIPEAVDNYTLTFTNGGVSSWYGQVYNSMNGGDSARSGVIGHSQSTYMETTAVGPGPVSFYWSVSSESGYDYLRFYINGIQQNQISGTVGWTLQTYTLAAGNNTLRWTYSKDGSVVSGSDCGWVDMILFANVTPTISATRTNTRTITPTFTVTSTATITRTRTITHTITRTPSQAPTISIPEAVDNYGLVFTNGGNASWYGQVLSSFYGGDSGRSGAIGHNQYTYMETTISGAGTVDFYWSVSSEYGYDYLRFYINGTLQDEITGNIGWTAQSYTLGAGSNVLNWTYSKDGSVVDGSDCGWVDMIVINGTPPVIHTVTPTITGTPPTATITPVVTQIITPVGPGMSWELAVDPAAFAGRLGHTSLVFDNKMWVIAGSGTMAFNDVWYSTDGMVWTCAAASTAFPERVGHTSLVYNNKMWVIGGGYWSGGYDVWSSVDGITWTVATSAAAFSQRQWHSSVVFNNKMWVIGGMGMMSVYNDIWSSTDGVTWTQETAAAAFTARAMHSCVVFNGRMWLTGGNDGTGNGFNDVWSSVDGINWVMENAAAGFSQREGGTLLSYSGRLWYMAGYDTNAGYFINDVWSTADGITWSQETAAANFQARVVQSGVVYDNRMWLIGGYDNMSNYRNDVWYSPPAFVLSQTPTAVPNTQPTITPTVTPGPFEVTNTIIFPNPFNPNVIDTIGFKYDVSRDISQASVKIYTVSFKLVRSIDLAGAGSGSNTKTTTGKYFQGMASGIYYYYIEARDYSGNTKKSKISTMVILN